MKHTIKNLIIITLLIFGFGGYIFATTQTWETVVSYLNGITGSTIIAGTANQITVASSSQTITLSTPQNIHTGASPTFAGLTLTDFGGFLKATAGVVGTSTLPFKAKIAFETPTATDDFFFEELNNAVTFTSIYCKTLVGTVDLDVQIAGSDINGTDITCTTDGVLDDSLGGDTSGAVGEELKLAVTSVASAPTYLMVQVNGTIDD